MLVLDTWSKLYSIFSSDNALLDLWFAVRCSFACCSLLVATCSLIVNRFSVIVCCMSSVSILFLNMFFRVSFSVFVLVFISISVFYFVVCCLVLRCFVSFSSAFVLFSLVLFCLYFILLVSSLVLFCLVFFCFYFVLFCLVSFRSVLFFLFCSLLFWFFPEDRSMRLRVLRVVAYMSKMSCTITKKTRFVRGGF